MEKKKEDLVNQERGGILECVPAPVTKVATKGVDVLKRASESPSMALSSTDSSLVFEKSLTT